MATVKAIITTLDNLPLLKEQARILGDDPLVNEIVVVSNGSQDGTIEWLAGQHDLTRIIKRNNGAGPGRNAGIAAAGEFDYALFLDGGIRPLIGGTERMLDYLERTLEADVIGVEIADFETDSDKAWRRWPSPILPADTYQNVCLSHTAYCLTRDAAWDGLRFCEEGPFGEPGWGVDDDEMACQWADVGIIVHVVTGIHPYRRASGSFRRLYLETGIWPNQYGSVYEKRLVWVQQHWPRYGKGTTWGEPEVVVVVKVTDVETTAKAIKTAHDTLRQRKQPPPWDRFWLPYHVLAWGDCEGWAEWAEPRRLRQHHGSCITLGEEIIRRSPDNEAMWTGDFILTETGITAWPDAEVIVIEQASELGGI
jgi:hypothetical protein